MFIISRYIADINPNQNIFLLETEVRANKN